MVVEGLREFSSIQPGSYSLNGNVINLLKYIGLYSAFGIRVFVPCVALALRLALLFT